MLLRHNGKDDPYLAPPHSYFMHIYKFSQWFLVTRRSQSPEKAPSSPVKSDRWTLISFYASAYCVFWKIRMKLSVHNVKEFSSFPLCQMVYILLIIVIKGIRKGNKRKGKRQKKEMAKQNPRTSFSIDNATTIQFPTGGGNKNRIDDDRETATAEVFQITEHR